MKLAILDLDGTLFRGSVPISGAKEAVEELLRQGVLVRCLTNNSTTAPDRVSEKLRGMGFAVQEGWVVTSALGAAWKLAGRCSRALVLGESGLIQALESVGICVELATDEPTGQPIDAVVVGLCRSATYASIARCQEQILKGASFIATNRDATYPIENGGLIPGAGSLVASVVTATGREPEVVGKPEPFLVQHIMAELGVAPSEVLVVGDRIDTDIEAGRRAGTKTFLVLTGVTPQVPEGYVEAYGSTLRDVLDYT